MKGGREPNYSRHDLALVEGMEMNEDDPHLWLGVGVVVLAVLIAAATVGIALLGVIL